MEEQEWMKFESTGNILDYLCYREHTCSRDTDTLTSAAGQDARSRSVTGYGADHSADRNGVISRPSGRI